RFLGRAGGQAGGQVEGQVGGRVGDDKPVRYRKARAHKGGEGVGLATAGGVRLDQRNDAHDRSPSRARTRSCRCCAAWAVRTPSAPAIWAQVNPSARAANSSPASSWSS